MQTSDKIYIAGHRGMVGSSLVRKLQKEGFTNLLFRSSQELDLKDSCAVKAFFEEERPSYVFLAAAKVGGILANKMFKADFIYENLMIQTNVIHQAYKTGVKKLLFLGSSCIYPRLAQQPIKESYLLSGKLEETNDAYAIAKIAGIKMCEAYRSQYNCQFISAMPTNLYGPNDNYDLQNAHVLPALLRRIITAKQENEPEIMIWGTGNPKREFMHVDDLADACYFLMQHYNGAEIMNVGTGTDISISDLAKLIMKEVGYTGNLRYDISKPDGTQQKLLDVSRINNLGWKHRISLEDGISSTYFDFLTNAPAIAETIARRDRLRQAI